MGGSLCIVVVGKTVLVGVTVPDCVDADVADCDGVSVTVCIASVAVGLGVESSVDVVGPEAIPVQPLIKIAITSIAANIEALLFIYLPFICKLY